MNVVPVLLSAIALQSAVVPPAAPAAPPDRPAARQAVVETTLGTFVIELLPDAAPNHVAHFIGLAAEGAYDGTTFHRVVRHGIIQGGDPLSVDPAKRDLYGTGGLGVLEAEISGERHTRGAVSAVQIPGRPDSAGAQFFVCIVDQPALDGQYTVFGRVVEGMAIAQAVSEAEVDADGHVIDRIEIRRVTVRAPPPPEPVPFEAETPDELAGYRAVLETTLGEIGIELLPDVAPEHVRNFLRLSATGVYDGTAFHRVVPGFVIQTGLLSARREPLPEHLERHVRTLDPEFNNTPHLRGTVSMARGDDPASASTSFFICTAPAPSLDGVYTAFGRVVSGLDVVEAIEGTPVEGETPVSRIEVVRIRVERIP